MFNNNQMAADELESITEIQQQQDNRNSTAIKKLFNIQPALELPNFRAGTGGVPTQLKTHQDFFKPPPITYYDNTSSQEFESMSFN
jgi:hypothetical protein